MFINSYFQLQNAQTLRLQGYEQFNWKRRKLWSQLESCLREISQKLELWRGSLKYIEGNFGTGVVTYFLFLKWLFFLNLFISIFIVLFLMLPTIVIDYKEESTNCTDIVDCCSARYFNSSDTDNFILIDLVQGTGILEHTVLFYGYYSNRILDYKFGDFTMYYNVPFAFIALTLFYFLFSLFLIIRTSAKGFRDRLVEGEGQFYQYCNLVFGGWDFCINNDKSARIKHKAIFNDLKGTLEMEKLEEERQNRTGQEKTKLYFCRVLINFLILLILVGCAVGIYFLFDYSTSCLNNLRNNNATDNNWEKLAYEFLPSITIVTMNIIVPMIFSFLITFEKYSPIFEIRFTLFRTVFLRLASLVVYYASFKQRVSCDESYEDFNSAECVPCSKDTPVPTCWETFVGQQIYKLLLTDFGTHIVLTFLLNFLRSLLAKHLDNKFIKFIGEQTFLLPKHALDVVYTQTLCWFGIFYAPLISVMATIIFFFMFYIKKFACVINSKPTPIVYKASRSNSMFMLVLLLSYMFALFPIAYSVSEMLPSKSCGPFRGRESVWSLIVNLFTDWPSWVQECIYFLSTAGFAIPFFIILLLLLYYYSAVNSANRHMVHILKNQLVLEGHDKQFLLDRLSYFIKQESQKRARTEQSRDRST